MVIIRLALGGSKKRPFYRIVVADQRNKRDGRCIERIGYFNPKAQGQAKRLHIELERVKHWVGQGAQASDRVQKLISEASVGLEKAAA